MTLFHSICDAAQSIVQYQVKVERNEFEKRAVYFDKNEPEDQQVLQQTQQAINDPARVDEMLCQTADQVLRQEEKASSFKFAPSVSPEMLAAMKGPKKIDRKNDSSGYKAFKKIFPIIEKAEAYHDHMAGVQYMMEMNRSREKIQAELREKFPKPVPPEPPPPLPSYDYQQGMSAETYQSYQSKSRAMDEAIAAKTVEMKKHG